MFRIDTNFINNKLIIIVFVAIVLRIAIVFINGDYVEPNAWEYGAIAENIRVGNGYSISWYEDEEPIPTSFQGPFYVYFLVAAYSLPYKFLIIQLFQSVVWGVNCLLVYGLIKELGENDLIAVLTAVGVAIYPALVYSSTQLHHTTFSFALITGALWALIKAKQVRSYRAAVCGGLFFGLYALNEPVIFGFLPMALIWMIWRRKRNTVLAVLLITTTLITVLPWSTRNAYVHRSPVIIKSNVWQAFWIGNNPAATGSLRTVRGSSIFYNEMPAEMAEKIRQARTESERSAILRDEAFSYVRKNPGGVLLTDLKKIVHLWWFDPYHPKGSHPFNWVPWQIAFLLAMAGIILKGRVLKEYIPILLLAISYSITYAVFVPTPRNMFIFIPYFLALAATTVTTAIKDFSIYLKDAPKL
jgi:hypothetical protein